MAQGTARIGKDKYRTQISVGGRGAVRHPHGAD